MAYTTIDKPSDYFNTKLFTGNGSNGHAISGLDFQPDWVWLKNRNTTNTHEAFDSVRGATKTLYPDRSDAEYVNATGSLTSFNSDGFTVGSGDGANKSGSGIASWNWKAGTSFTNDASSTGIGTIDSTGSVSQEAGFSIISYTGNGTANQSVAHGLGATPKFIIIKPRSAVGYWCVTNPRFVSVSDPNILYLQETAAEADDTNINGTTAPSSTVFGVDDYGAVNTNGQTQIAYCFTPIKGYSAMGTYVGNGSTDGTFVYTGFKPAWVMVKRTDSTNDWKIIDNKRSPINPTAGTLKANSSGAEDTSEIYYDFCANGYKIRLNAGALNASGGTYIYMAFAENPFVTSTGVPATAR